MSPEFFWSEARSPAEAGALVGELGSFLKPAWKKPLSNGGLDGVLAKYECIEGKSSAAPHLRQ